MHWIRHTALTWVERNFGYAVARACAGHTDGGGSETGAAACDFARSRVRRWFSARSRPGCRPVPDLRLIALTESSPSVHTAVTFSSFSCGDNYFRGKIDPF